MRKRTNTDNHRHQGVDNIAQTKILQSNKDRKRFPTPYLVIVVGNRYEGSCRIGCNELNSDVPNRRHRHRDVINGHAVGNLLLAALWDRDEDTVAGLDRVGALLKVIGRVLPMASEPLDIEATFENSIGTKIVRGQAEVATTKGRLKSLRIIPENPTAYPEALAAIADAEWITMGPGSWFSSVIPHLLVPAQRDAIISSEAKKILLLNLDIADKSAGEYAGYSPLEHLHILSTYAPALHFDCVVIDSSAEGQSELREHLSTIGSELVVADLRSAGAPLHHDVKKLGQLFSHIDSQILVG